MAFPKSCECLDHHAQLHSYQSSWGQVFKVNSKSSMKLDIANGRVLTSNI